jgi:hypothetical protein
MTPLEQYRADMTAVYAAAAVLATVPVDRMLAAIDTADAVAPILDPTLYQQQARAMHEDRDVLRAALPLAELGRKLRARTEEAAR